MSQFVWTCRCGWRGVSGGRGRSPEYCGGCGESPIALTRSSEDKPRITCRCEDCQSPFLALQGSRFCPKHRPLHLGNAAWRNGSRQRKYIWTAEKDAYVRRRYDGKVKRRSWEIARTLGWPVWQIKKRAQALGLATPLNRRDFTPAEVAVIEEWTGLRSSHWIARRLKRSDTSVILKQKRMGLSRRVRDGYTVGAVSECFGVDHHSVDRWIREGQLQAKRRGTARAGKQGDIFKVTDADLRTFIRQNPNAFRLDKVDQVWFLDLILGSPRATSDREGYAAARPPLTKTAAA